MKKIFEYLGHFGYIYFILAICFKGVGVAYKSTPSTKIIVEEGTVSS